MFKRVTNRDTSANKSGIDPYIVSLDIGTSSVRTLLFDGGANQQDDFGKQIAYQPETTADGGVEIDADMMFKLCEDALDFLHQQITGKNLRPAGVGISAFWHSFLGVDAAGHAISPIYHLLDVRSAKQAENLRQTLNPEAVHARTGCVIHTSYWPAKLLWLAEERQEITKRAAMWMSFGEYLFLRLFGKPIASSSMLSGTGLWNQNANRYDEEVLAALPVRKSQLASTEILDRAGVALLSEFKQRWPAFDGIPWYPAFGDGACNNVGSGCVTPDRFSLMVGTTGAMRAVITSNSITIPPGLWCYRVDSKRFVLGGALSNGGKVFEWMNDTLQLPTGAELERQLGAMEPGAHGLTFLPLFAGERSPGWRSDARAAVTGMTLHTRPIELMRAALEAVALRFRLIYGLMSQQVAMPKEIVASGGALLHSPVWTQMMADALGRPITASSEHEASSRGAALLALERLGAIQSLDAIPADIGDTLTPVNGREQMYGAMLDRMQSLYRFLCDENGTKK